MVAKAFLAHHVAGHGHGKLVCVSDLHPTSRRVCDRLRRSDDPARRSLVSGVRDGHRRKYDPEYFHDLARGLAPFVQSSHQLLLRAGLDCRNRRGAHASRRANAYIRNVQDHLVVQVGYYRNPDDGNRCRGRSDVNADLAGSNSAGTSRCCCQTRSRRQTRRARAATSFGVYKTGCAGTTPSSRWNKPSGRSDTAPSPTARNQPTSNRTAAPMSNVRTDTAPNRRTR